MRKNYLCGLCIIMIFFIVGCRSEKISYDWLPQVKGENEILLYDRFEQRLLTYDLEENVILSQNSALNYFQLEFQDNPSADIYTTGHSIDNNFKIVELENGKANTLYRMSDLEAIFPLAYKGDNEQFFVKAFYNQDGEEFYDKRVICHFDRKEKKLTEYKKTEGKLISKGVYLNDYLYYTIYDMVEDNYELLKLDPLKMEKTPEIVMHNLEQSEVYAYNNEILHSDSKNIYVKEASFPKSSLNYIYRHYLIQLGPDLEGDLSIGIINLKSNQKELQTKGVVDFKIKQNTLDVYTHTGIEQLELEP